MNQENFKIDISVLSKMTECRKMLVMDYLLDVLFYEFRKDPSNYEYFKKLEKSYSNERVLWDTKNFLLDSIVNHVLDAPIE